MEENKPRAEVEARVAIQARYREDDYHRIQRERIEVLEKEVELLKTRMDTPEGKPKKGRPPKDKENKDATNTLNRQDIPDGLGQPS